LSRITIILFITIIISGCSSLKRTGKIFNKEEAELVYEEDIAKLNISNFDFDIDKAEIEIISNNNKQILLANLKYRKEGSYLISIRIKAGFEVARLYLTKDTILINDKIKRKIYSASPGWLNDKYGISMDALPIIFGDYIEAKNINNPVLKCTNGFIEKNEKIINKDIRYRIDCEYRKVSRAKLGEISKEESVLFYYENFKNQENYIFPGKIEIQDTYKSLIIRINIEKINFTDLENVYFIPGKNYEEVILK